MKKIQLPKARRPRVKVNLRLEADHLDKLRAVCLRRNVTLTHYIEAAINQFVPR